MKNRAIWLALVVVVLATLLMVFYVLPGMGPKSNADGQKAAGQQAQTEAPAPTNTPQTPVAAAPAESAAQKMARLQNAADQSVKALEAGFDGDNLPTAEAFAATRLAAMTALKALADQDIPADLAREMAMNAAKIKKQAAAALALLTKLPQSPADAALDIANIGHAWRGEPLKDPNIPHFDVLRVEKDGSTVIAGSAAPGARVDVMEGDKVIAGTTASKTGDFAIVLDKPLAPGDHALDLRATTADGKTLKSEEQATVSVPAGKNGDVLAMVSKQGEASRVLTPPDQINDAAKQARVPAANGDIAAQTEAQSQNGQSQNQQSPAAPKEGVSMGTDPALMQQLRITAVELEGAKIFVAGTAPKDYTVTAYADQQKIGDSDVDQNNKFVVEGEMPLAVGQHIISVDLKDQNGKIILRASVPFDRPEGNQVTVAAQPGTDAGQNTNQPTPADQAFFDQSRDTLAKSFTLLSNLFANGQKPSQENMQAARSATEFALKSLGDFRPAPGGNPVLADFMTRMAANARKALDAFMEISMRSVDDMAAAMPRLKPLVEAALAPMPDLNGAGLASNQQNALGPITISQAPLTASPNMVIIRRGDTLWQISRRVYGQGVRYTTIYMANAEQISNPDLIEPGQTFSVPDKSLPDNEAEAIHRKWVHDHKR